MLSCVEINEELGKEYIPTRHLYDVYTDTIYLTDIRMKNTDKLSGYSSSRITIGSVRDELFAVGDVRRHDASKDGDLVFRGHAPEHESDVFQPFLHEKNTSAKNFSARVLLE